MEKATPRVPWAVHGIFSKSPRVAVALLSKTRVQENQDLRENCYDELRIFLTLKWISGKEWSHC